MTVEDKLQSIAACVLGVVVIAICIITIFALHNPISEEKTEALKNSEDKRFMPPHEYY